MARTPQDVTDAELAVLQVLWERGPATRRQIAESLNPGAEVAAIYNAYNTVQKLLERLQVKGHVRRAVGARGVTFTAVTDREQLIRLRLHDVADRLCGGSLTPLLMNLVRAKPLSADELQDLQNFVKELNRQAKPKDKPR